MHHIVHAALGWAEHCSNSLSWAGQFSSYPEIPLIFSLKYKSVGKRRNLILREHRKKDTPECKQNEALLSRMKVCLQIYHTNLTKSCVCFMRHESHSILQKKELGDKMSLKHSLYFQSQRLKNDWQFWEDLKLKKKKSLMLTISKVIELSTGLWNPI